MSATSSSSYRRTGVLTATALTGLLALVLVGCSSSTKQSTASSAPMAANALDTPSALFNGNITAGAGDATAPQPSAPGHGFAAPAAGSAAPAAPAPSPTTPGVLANRQIVYTADITVRTTNVRNAVNQVQAIATGPTSQGAVYAEQIDLTPKDAADATATITLKVPPNTLEGDLDKIGKLGAEISRDEQDDDVTTQVVDVSARLTAAKDSLNRLEQLFQHAGTVGDLTDLESQIAQRESDLDSLESQQRALSGEVAQATITVTLVTTPVAAKKKAVKHTHVFGFVRGLRGGWHAFTRTTAALATALGAALPFLIVLVALGFIALLGRRYLSRQHPAHISTTEPAPITEP